MPKTTYTPEEYADKWLRLIDNVKDDDSHWFCDRTKQDRLLYNFAKEIYLCYEENDVSFHDCLVEADKALTEFYNYKYNPNTRK